MTAVNKYGAIFWILNENFHFNRFSQEGVYCLFLHLTKCDSYVIQFAHTDTHTQKTVSSSPLLPATPAQPMLVSRLNKTSWGINRKAQTPHYSTSHQQQHVCVGVCAVLCSRSHNRSLTKHKRCVCLFLRVLTVWCVGWL